MATIKEIKEITQELSVLYVEDDPSIRESIAAYLIKIFNHVQTAQNGKEGLEKYQQEHFDMVMSDISMPVMDGLEMSRRIRKICDNQVIIIVSAYSSSDYFVSAIKTGISGYIIKPVDYGQMNDALYQSAINIRAINETANYKAHLEEMVEERTKELNSSLKTEKRMREILRTIADVNDLIITCSELEKLGTQSCKTLTLYKPYKYAFITLIQKNKTVVCYQSREDISCPGIIPAQTDDEKYTNCPVNRSIRENRTVIVIGSNAEECPKVARAFEHLDACSLISIPLRATKVDKSFGAICVYSEEEIFLDEESAMLEELAGDLGFAINDIYLKEQHQRLQNERIENYEKTLYSFINMVEKRDAYTAGHSQRVADYSRLIAEEMGYPSSECDKLYRACILHDIGKVATPDSILLKPDKLTSLEYKLIQEHVTGSYEMLVQIPMYKELAEIIHHHHERYDGHGYPSGLKGNDIPPLSRIMIVADAFDAMTTNRIYKGRKSITEALEEIKKLRRQQFHPDEADAAIKVLGNISIGKNISQLPTTQIENERFAYFFRDRIADVHNKFYLDLILHREQEKDAYGWLTIFYLRNFTHYNHTFGWQKGDEFLAKFARLLKKIYPDMPIFRIHGDDFLILYAEPLKVDKEAIMALPLFKDKIIELEVADHALKDLKVDDIDDFDRGMPQ